MKATLKKLWEWIKKPHGIPLVLFYVFTAAFVACAIVFSVLGQDKGFGVIAYVFYGLAAPFLSDTPFIRLSFSFRALSGKLRRK